MKPNRRIKELGSDSGKFYVDMLAVCNQLHNQMNSQSHCVISYGRIVQTSLGQRSDEEKLESIAKQASKAHGRSTIYRKSRISTQQSIDCKAQMRRVDFI